MKLGDHQPTDAVAEPGDRAIHVSFVSSAEQILQAARLHARTLNRDKRQRWQQAYWVLVILTPIIVAAFMGRTVLHFAIGQLVFFFVAIWFAFTGPLGKARFRRDYQKKFGDQVQVDWRITPEALDVRDAKGTAATLTWRVLDKVVRTPKGFLVCVHAQLYYWLPLTGFSSLEDISRFAELAKEKAELYIEANEKDVK